jgi:hypothetical protein
METFARMVSVPDEKQRVIDTLRAAGVSGADDFGYFVNPEHFRPSEFDQRAALPVLLDLLPSLTDAKVVAAAARHLRQRAARPTAFVPLLGAYERWATNTDLDTGWALGDALVTAATTQNAAALFHLAVKREYGKSRQMIVYQLWRFRSEPETQHVLASLLEDPDVSLHAISSYRRTVGDETALPILVKLEAKSEDPKVRKQAERAVRAIEKKRR